MVIQRPQRSFAANWNWFFSEFKIGPQLKLTPQAGVALGMTLVAVGHFPDLKETLIAVTIGTTVFFELIGPALTQLALRIVGEAK